MPTKKQYQTRLAPDTADSVDEYADRHDVTAAEAVRRLIRAGLDAEQDDTLDPDEIRADLDEIRADLRELREAIEDEAEDEAEDGREVKTWYQVGGTPERVAGLVLAAIVTLGAVVFATVALATLVT